MHISFDLSNDLTGNHAKYSLHLHNKFPLAFSN